MDVDWQSILLSIMITLVEDLRDLHSKFTRKAVLKVMLIYKEHILNSNTPMHSIYSCACIIYFSNNSATTHVSFGMAAVTIVDFDEESHVLTLRAWLRYVSLRFSNILLKSVNITMT